jgi:hypothetical protein
VSKKYVKERDRAFIAGDMKWFAKQLPWHARKVVIEMAFHKARLEIVTLPENLRRESAQWLVDRGLKRTDGSDPFSALREDFL